MNISSVFATSHMAKAASVAGNFFSSVAAVPAVRTSDTVSISRAARELSAAQNKSAGQAPSGEITMLDTSQGPMSVDDYLSPSSRDFAMFPPILLPSQKTVDTLSRHISSMFSEFLAENNIPSPPSTITYGDDGKMQLPADFAYADEFKRALDKAPKVEMELRTINSLTSHLVEMSKVAPFNQEYAAAPSKVEAEAVVAKYRYLFSGNQHHDTIALNFAANGSLTLTADGKLITVNSRPATEGSVE